MDVNYKVDRRKKSNVKLSNFINMACQKVKKNVSDGIMKYEVGSLIYYSIISYIFFQMRGRP